MTRGAEMISIARRAAAPVYTLALFASAALIFTLQPLVGRLMTPLLGGSPAVWNTSMAFFQGALLVGYVYAHVLARIADIRVQAAIHALVLLLAWFVLPVHVNAALGPPNSDAPAFWLFGVLTLSVGAPFAAASATAPLLQAWYARSGRADANDPYYLYAASNLGSFVGLLAYPILVEPQIGLAEQTGWWSLGYGLVAALILAAGAVAATVQTPQTQTDAGEAAAAPRWKDRFYWLAAAAIPSALILGVTQHISTDIASAPFLWVAPLALYLLTFVVAFAKQGARIAPFVLLLHPAALAFLIIANFLRADFIWMLVAHLVAFFLSALVCHQALARARPNVERLTEFYFFVSLGGVVGGALVAFVAPLIFNDIYEYPLALAATALFRPVREVYFRSMCNALAVATGVMALIALALMVRGPIDVALFAGGLGAAAALISAALPAYEGKGVARQRVFLGLSIAFAALMTFALFQPEALIRKTVAGGAEVISLIQPLGYGLLTLGFLVLTCGVHASLQMRRDDPRAHALATDIALGVAIPLIALFVLFLVMEQRLDRDVIIRFGLGIAAVALIKNRDRPYLLAALVLAAFATIYLHDRSGGRVVQEDRSFFGVLRQEEFVLSQAEGAPKLRMLLHGTTIHGAQLQGDAAAERHPLTYYNPGTALGQAIVAGLSTPENHRLALIGLGTGTTACLLDDRDRLTIFEIDPLVMRLSASQNGPFSYVRNCAPDARLVLGDARLKIADEPNGAFDVIVVDAFSSDAIPAHLLTREAVATYLEKTGPTGVVILHLSNRNLALVAEAVRVAHSLNAPYLWSVSDRVSDETAGPYTGLPASAMILARSQETLDALDINRAVWRTLPTPPGRAWSDDYINLPRAVWESVTGLESCLQNEEKLDCDEK